MEGNQASGGRQKLLEAANQTFAQQDYEAAAVSQILTLAGVQAPTLYHHFQDKEGLFVEWATLALAELGAALNSATSSRSHPLDELTGFAAALLRSTNIDILQTLRDAQKMARPDSREQIFLAFLRSVHEPLCAVMVRALQANVIANEPVGCMANLFLMGSLSLSTRYGFENVDPNVAAEWWAKRFLEGFRKAYIGKSPGPQE